MGLLNTKTEVLKGNKKPHAGLLKIKNELLRKINSPAGMYITRLGFRVVVLKNIKAVPQSSVHGLQIHA